MWVIEFGTLVDYMRENRSIFKNIFTINLVSRDTKDIIDQKDTLF